MLITVLFSSFIDFSTQGPQRMWESGQPCLLKPPTPRHSGLFEVQQEPFVLLHTMSTCVSISSAYPRPRVPELGASRRNSPLWGCLCTDMSINHFPRKHTQHLADEITSNPSSRVYMFPSYYHVICSSLLSSSEPSCFQSSFFLYCNLLLRRVSDEYYLATIALLSPCLQLLHPLIRVSLEGITLLLFTNVTLQPNSLPL